MPHATAPSPGLQALVLCGPGLSLNTFTSNPRDFPKALVPIANRPMVWYALDWCYRIGVSNITLVTPPESKPALQSALNTHPALTSLPSPRPEILGPLGLDQTTATGQILRLPEVQNCITSDFFVVPCDLVSELDGLRLLEQWISLNALSSSSNSRKKGGLGFFYPTQGREGISHKKEETDFIATVPLSKPPAPPPPGSLRPDIQQLVLTMPSDTFKDNLEEHKDILKLRYQMTRKYGNVRLKTKHRDLHVYIFPKWVKNFVARNARFESVSEDVLGWWAKATWQQGLGQRLAMDAVLTSSQTTHADLKTSTQDADDFTNPVALSSTRSSRSISSTSCSTYSYRVSNTSENLEQDLEIPPLFAYVQPALASGVASNEQPLVRRVDTSAAILNVSLYIAKQPTTHVLSHGAKMHATVQLGHQSRVAQEDSLVAENVKIGNRVVIKESVIGANCEIGNNVRLTRCLLMDAVAVGDGVQMTGCIIGRRARIQGMKVPEPTAAPGESSRRKKDGGDDGEDERTRLTDCEVAPNFVIDAGTEAKGEKMMVFDTDDLDDLEDDSGAADEEA